VAFEGRGDGRSNGLLYFIVGALVVSVAVLAWMMLSGPPRAEDDAFGRAADSIGDAADSISDTARDATRNIPAPAPAPVPAPVTPPSQ